MDGIENKSKQIEREEQMKAVSAIGNFIAWAVLRCGLAYIIWLAVFKETETLTSCDWAKNILWMTCIGVFVLGIAKNVCTQLAEDDRDSRWALELCKRWAPLQINVLAIVGFAGFLVAGGWCFSAILWCIGGALCEVSASRAEKGLAS